MKATNRLLYGLLTVLAVFGAFYLYQAFREPDSPTAAQMQQEAQLQQEKAAPTLAVTHELVGRDLKLKLKVTNFTFSLENMGKENRYGEGHVHLYVDGKKVLKLFEENGLWKNMQPGTHRVMVELAHNNHDSYGIKREFQVDVK